MRGCFLFLAATIFLSFSPPVQAQHLWWSAGAQREATCLYGQITVLATAPGLYYCGANWHPGEPAGGYCGIQDINPGERWTIFSVWDTSETLQTEVTGADCRVVFNRFGGEGTGGHSHRVWQWQAGQPFEFFVQKRPSRKPDSIDARYYLYDHAQNRWQYVSTITSPYGGHKSVATFDSLVSFLENFRGENRGAAKVALYRLWLGRSPDKMECLTRASGDGKWGWLHDAYFLAEGDAEELDAVFAHGAQEYGKPVFGVNGKEVNAISNRPVPAEVVMALASLPANEIPDGLVCSSLGYVTPERRRANGIQNGSFELDGKEPWFVVSWANKGIASVVNDQAKEGERSLVIRATEADDTRCVQKVPVKPNTLYLLSGWIKTKGVVIGQKGGCVAANLSIEGVCSGRSVEGTSDWSYVYVTFDSGSRKELDICARLGHYGSVAKGAAWFDDIVLVEIPEQSCVAVGR